MEPLVPCWKIGSVIFLPNVFLQNTGWDGGVNCSVKFTFVSVDQNILRG